MSFQTLDQVRVAAIQMCTGCDLDKNLVNAEQFIKDASMQGARIVVLPEYFPYMGPELKSKLDYQEAAGSGPIQEMLSRCAREYSVWIFGGSMPMRSDKEKRPYARCLVYDDKGQYVAGYDKIHMFDVDIDDNVHQYRESSFSKPGTSPTVVNSPWGKIGISICYDLRFPELYRYYAEQGVNMVVIPSAFTVPTGRAHWEVLLKARAIENQIFVIAAAQGGMHENHRETWGHSMIVDPWGHIVGELQQESGVLTATLNLSDKQALAEKMPVLNHRIFK